MKLFKGINKVLSTGGLRPILQNAIIHNGHIVATNSYILAKINLIGYGLCEDQINLLEGKVFNKALLDILQKEDVEDVEIRKDSIFLRTKNIELKYTDEIDSSLSFKKDGGIFPNYEMLLSDSTSKIENIMFDYKYLNDLSNCLQNPNHAIKLEFEASNKAIKVTGDLDGYFFGIIIPVMNF